MFPGDSPSERQVLVMVQSWEGPSGVGMGKVQKKHHFGLGAMDMQRVPIPWTMSQTTRSPAISLDSQSDTVTLCQQSPKPGSGLSPITVFKY